MSLSEAFAPAPATVGGLLIGLSASALLWLDGEVLGVSGIVGSAVTGGSAAQDRSWRLLFIAGLAAGGIATRLLVPSAFEAVDGSMARAAVAGLLVGYGTRLGSGCTSGHGVCGIGRRSVRSIVATMTFMAAAVLTVLVDRHVVGGRP
jgi:uncharacterized protein